MQDAELVARHAPELEPGFRECYPLAQSALATKLAEALWREDIGDARERFRPEFRGRVHAFERIVLDPVEADPLSLVDHKGLREELASAVTGLALAMARRRIADETRRADAQANGQPDMPAFVAGMDSDRAGVALEQLATEGHNLHPCGRTRLGWNIRDMLRHDLETASTGVVFLRVPSEELIGDDLGKHFGLSGLPVHAWQLEHLRQAHPQLGFEVVDELVAYPTAALRTLLVVPGKYLKLSLDIHVTSTRRTVSTAATQNGPVMSRIIGELIDDDSFLLMPELAGAASPLGTGREMSAILRAGLAGRTEPGEVAVPGSALPATDPLTGRTIVAGLVDRSGLGAYGFIVDYARLLLPAVLRLAARHGIGLEAHLQNCVPTFVEGRPHRMGLRDFAGLRIMADQAPPLWPDSVIVTANRAEMLSKVAYTTLQAHLGELVIQLTKSHDLDEDRVWRAVRDIVAEILEGHRDLAFYTAPSLPHKALTRMRLAVTGDVYVPVRNPLHG